MYDGEPTLENYTAAIVDFCERRDWERFHRPKDLAIGVATEASELLQLFRFLEPDQQAELMEDDRFRAKVGDELADVLFFLVRFAERFRFDLVKEGMRKLEASEERYPVEEVRGSNIKHPRPW